MHWLLHALDPIFALCNDWCLHFWEVVGVWFTGAATFTAVVVSLWLARRQIRPQILIHADTRVFISGVPKGTPSVRVGDFPDVVLLDISNIGMIPVKITAVWWGVRFPRILRWLGLRPRGALFQNPPDVDERSHALPANLAPSDQLQWALPYALVTDNIAQKLLATSRFWWRLRLRYLRVHAATTVDVNVAGVLGPTLRSDLRDRVQEILRAA